MGGPTPPKRQKRSRRVRPTGPKTRAAFAVDAVLTRTGGIEIRRQYAGPFNVEPEDMVNLVSGVVAAWVSTAFPEEDVRAEVKDLLLDTLDRRIATATVTGIEEEPEQIEGEVE